MKLRNTISLAALTVATFVSMPALAQDTATDSAEADQAIVVTGIRGQARTIADSPVPVDVFSAKDLENVSYTDANDILASVAPSYTLSRQPISDGASFIRPASLRGLPTDKTLVLVNGKRRHRAALVSIGGSGTQGPDIATIPGIALKSVQVLRDGAAAQYGSDAIAGVINFILKDGTGLDLSAQTGQYYAGDGFEYTLSGNYGIALGDSGFIDLSAEYHHANATSRATQYCESYFCVTDYAATHPTYAAAIKEGQYAGQDVVQPWGQPKSESFRSFVNAGYTFSDAVEFYGFGNYSVSKATENFFYRFPHNGTIEYVRKPDGSLWWPLDLFPGGFTPQFHGKVIDYSALGGLRGELGDSSFTYDLSARYGHDEIKYTIDHTINPSMGPDTPTSFAPGNLINEERQVQLDLTKEFEVGFFHPLTLAFGGSYMKEKYEIQEGDPNSYYAGPYSQKDPWDFCNTDGTPTAAGLAVASSGLDCSNSSDPVYQVMGVGSNGFPGYSPAFSGSYKRHSYAAYGDVSADITEKLFLEGAVRYEDYSDFASQWIYKIAGRYKIDDHFSFRASLGTGFRAPTPGQQGTTNVSTRISETGEPIASGLFPAGSAVAQAIGAQPLKPEKSVNYTAGLTATFGAFNMTMDFYRIKLKDRMYAVSPIAIVDDCDTATAGIQTDCAGYRGNLINAGVVGANSIGQVQYFANIFNTITEGVDIVASYAFRWDNGSRTNVSAALNYNTTSYTGEVSSQFNLEDQADFLNSDPHFKAIVTANHTMGAFDATVRGTYYGPYQNTNGGSTITQIQNFSSNWYVDLEAGYKFMDKYRVAVGVRNLFDNYPDPGKFEAGQGRIYRSDSIVDWQGGYYYAKVTASF